MERGVCPSAPIVKFMTGENKTPSRSKSKRSEKVFVPLKCPILINKYPETTTQDGIGVICVVSYTEKQERYLTEIGTVPVTRQ